MEYSKKYPISQRSSGYIQANWSRGYQEIDLYFNNQLLASFEGGRKLKKGVKKSISGFGEVELRLSENPMTLDIIIDGIHCSTNASHPKKELRKSSFFFWVIAVGAIVMSSFEVILAGQNLFGNIVAIIDILIIAVYIIAAIFVGKGKPWAFYLGFCCFCFFTLLSLLSMEWDFFSILFLVPRIVFLWFLISNLKYANETIKHSRFDKFPTLDLLDN